MVELKDFIIGTNFEEFCNYFRQNILLIDSSISTPNNLDLMRLFNVFDLVNFLEFEP